MECHVETHLSYIVDVVDVVGVVDVVDVGCSHLTNLA